jgi:hypothetical protein
MNTKKVDVIETKYKTKQQVLLEKQSKQTNKHYYIIITLNHYSFYFSFQNTKLKQKNKLKDIQNSRKYHQCFRNWARNRTKK